MARRETRCTLKRRVEAVEAAFGPRFRGMRDRLLPDLMKQLIPEASMEGNGRHKADYSILYRGRKYVLKFSKTKADATRD
jgi:hypothetical protein